jgi:hypothetical protein
MALFTFMLEPVLGALLRNCTKRSLGIMAILKVDNYDS